MIWQAFLNLEYGVERQNLDLSFDFLQQRAGFAIKEGIGYSPNQTRRGRRAKAADGIRTHNIALLHLRTHTTLSLSLLRMVEQLLSARNLNLIVGHVELLRDDDMGFFIIDREGIVRYAYTGSYVEGQKPLKIRPLPANDEILRELDRIH